MPNGLEIAKAAIDDFKKIQRYMLLAKKENATETYAELKEEYLSLKAILNVAGVNLAEIDKIKE
jgi:2-keto-3-deoxy-L-rhamnonate aldolase RhmA